MAVHKVLSAFALLLMIVVISHDQYPAGGGEAAEISLKRVNSKKFFATLGLDCKCCDGAEGECRSSWNSPCSKLQCHPWKYY